MIFRIICLCFIFGVGVAKGQQPSCSILQPQIERSQPDKTKIAWNIYAKNRTNGGIKILPSSRFQWNIEESNKAQWSEVLSGGVSPGQAELGSKPQSDSGQQSFKNLTAGQRLLVLAFDINRDVDTNAATALVNNHIYRITFTYLVSLSNEESESVDCRLVTQSQRFRFSRTAGR
jgi:hypothetical protein